MNVCLSKASLLRWKILVLASGANENHSPFYIFLNPHVYSSIIALLITEQTLTARYFAEGCYNHTLGYINLYSRQFQRCTPAALTTLRMLSMCHKIQLYLRTTRKATTCTLLPSATNLKIMRILFERQACPNWNCWVFWCKKPETQPKSVSICNTMWT